MICSVIFCIIADSSSAPGSPIMVHDDTPVFDVNVDTSEDVVHYGN